ncbi:MAG: serine/threonine protein kinase [Phycisphaerales bacterium]|nr:serine/threonine protein kinase [Phycisphaerales bacterium]
MPATLAPASSRTPATPPNAAKVTYFKPAKPGTKLAGFTVIAEVGRGAASTIYVVQDPSAKQIWALKHVALNTPKDQRFVDQAYAEYEVAQKVRNPLIRHIEKVIKSRELLSVKEVFLLMEYVDGVSVERHPPASLSQAVDVFRQTARALDHMHQCGYVHADMKPNNIVLTETGAVKIIDLGQACAVGTVKERIQGTPDYIAPEQVHRRAITPKTDIYNLGATMYWVLTQRHIPTAMPKGDSLVSSLDDQFIEKPQPVSLLNPRVPAALGELIMHCVEVNPDLRPASMREVADRLDEVYRALSGPAPAGK